MNAFLVPLIVPRFLDYRRDHSLLLPAVVMPKLSQGVGREGSATDGSSTASFATISSELTTQSDSDDGTGIQLSYAKPPRVADQLSRSRHTFVDSMLADVESRSFSRILSLETMKNSRAVTSPTMVMTPACLLVQMSRVYSQWCLVCVLCKLCKSFI